MSGISPRHVSGQNILFPTDLKDFISPRTRRIIFWSVLIAHFAIIVCPFLWYLIVSWLHPMNQPKGMTLIPVKEIIEGPPSRNPSKKNPNPSEPKSIPNPGKVEPLPPEPPPPAPEPAKPETKPAETKKAAETAVKSEKDAAKAREDVSKKKLTAEDIKKGSKTVKDTSPTKPTTQPTKPGSKFSADQFIKNVKNGVYQEAAPPGGGTPAFGVPDGQLDEYYSKIGNFLYGRWQTPAKSQLNGSKPTVDVQITIDASGNITAFSIVKKSGNFAMDNSVERLFSEVKVLPAPPKGMTFTVTMTPDDE